MKKYVRVGYLIYRLIAEVSTSNNSIMAAIDMLESEISSLEGYCQRMYNDLLLERDLSTHFSDLRMRLDFIRYDLLDKIELGYNNSHHRK
jgi:hypothetical protein